MVKLEKIDESKVSLEIEVEEALLEDALSQAYKKVVKKVSLPVFQISGLPWSFVLKKGIFPG